MHIPKKRFAAVGAGGWGLEGGPEGGLEGGPLEWLKKIEKYSPKRTTFQYFRPSDGCSNTFGGKCNSI